MIARLDDPQTRASSAERRAADEAGPP